MISVAGILIPSRQQIRPKQNGVQSTSTSARNRHGPIHKTDLITIIVRALLIANRVKHDLNSVHCSFVIWHLCILSRAEKSPFGVGEGVFPSERGDWSESALCVRWEVKPTKAHVDRRNE